jgi:hypothetical protein
MIKHCVFCEVGTVLLCNVGGVTVSGC